MGEAVRKAAISNRLRRRKATIATGLNPTTPGRTGLFPAVIGMRGNQANQTTNQLTIQATNRPTDHLLATLIRVTMWYGTTTTAHRHKTATSQTKRNETKLRTIIPSVTTTTTDVSTFLNWPHHSTNIRNREKERIKTNTHTHQLHSNV